MDCVIMPYRKKEGLSHEEMLVGCILLGALNPDGRTINTIAKKPIKAGQPVTLEIDIDKGVVYSEPVELRYKSE